MRDLERKVNTNYNSTKTHLPELEYFGLIKIIKHKKNEINGKPYKTVKLTRNGR